MLTDVKLGGNIQRAEAQKLIEAMKEFDWDNPEDCHAAASVISESIREDPQMQDILNLVADVRDYNLGDEIEFIGRKGAKAFIVAPGAYAPRSTIVRRAVTLDTDEVAVNVELNRDDLKVGRYGSISDVKRQIVKELTGMRYSLLWDALKWGVGKSTGGDLSGTYNYYTGLTTASGALSFMGVVNSALNIVDDKPHEGIVGIMGRRKLLDNFTLFTGYSQDYLSLRDRKMLIETYRGVPLLPIKQYTDGYDVARITANELFIMTRGVVKVGFKKRGEVGDAIDINTNTWNIVYRENYGMALIDPEYCFRINIADA